MDDLIERLRIMGVEVCWDSAFNEKAQKLADEAANELDRLRRELAEARELLREAREEWIDEAMYERTLPEFADKCRAFLARIDAAIASTPAQVKGGGDE